MAKGRDKQLIRKRDEALCRRYYYWTEAQSVRFDRALKIQLSLFTDDAGYPIAQIHRDS